MQRSTVDANTLEQFKHVVLEFYKLNGRYSMPWRQSELNGTFDPYKITVSELMLQQTQVNRVIGKYAEFLVVFPTVTHLANAPLSSVLAVWSGLGYYRRAKFLHQTAQKIMNEYGGTFPNSQQELQSLPGIGKNTAGAIMAYAYNKPVVYIETNIRTVYLHHFFTDQTDVPDSILVPLIEQTLDTNSPREWYWALMDYGSYIKSNHSNPSRKSKHHTVQSTFKGSRREARGQVLKLLMNTPSSLEVMKNTISYTELEPVIQDLLCEEMIHQVGNTYHLGK